ncbi:MAG: hypothetical protein J1F33_07685 [Clostridiales bacterium]|nr:hypothetical protein [Clostridiales bacterium]
MAKSEETKKNKISADRVANIIVIVVAALALIVLVAIIVLSSVKINPGEKLEKPKYYALYNVGETDAVATNPAVENEIVAALDGMDFSVMSAILEGHWNYSFTFKRNSSDKKIEIGASEVKAISSSSSEYMIELVYNQAKVTENGIDYKTAHCLEVEGEKVYFDRIKVLIGDTNGTVGTISLYPYLTARIDNNSDIQSLTPDTYKVTGLNIRANTTNTYAALRDLIGKIKLGTEI